MRNRNWVAAMVVVIALAGMGTTAQAQGNAKEKKGQKQEHAKPKYQQDGAKQGWQGDAKHENKEPEKAEHRYDKDDKHFDNVVSRVSLRREFVVRDTRPVLHRFIVSKRAPERIAAGAVTRAYARGLNDDVLVITNVGNFVRIANRSGLVLVELDDERARNLGSWDVRPLYDRVDSQAPAFCRSGAGHPVFGRQWCIDKGFGLGRSNSDVRWGRTTSNVNNIVFVRPATTGNLTRDALLNLLGNVAYDRLALHSVTLGYADPLSGVWIGDNTGPSVLQVNAGSYPVAEIVDSNRDNRADMLVVALRPW